MARKIKELGPWHNMNIGENLWTHPEAEGAGPDYPAWRLKLIEPLLPDVHGMNCPDIGCSSGFFSLKLKELGAQTSLVLTRASRFAPWIRLALLPIPSACKSSFGRCPSTMCTRST